MIRAPFAPTWAGWRVAARRLLHAAVPPHEVEWRPETEGQEALDLAIGELPREGTAPLASDEFRVPRAFVELAGSVACHRDPARWGLLYRVLWRLCHGEPRLLEVAVDPDVHRLLRMEKAVRRASHKMKAFVRFRAVEHDGDTHYVAWFEPEHDVLARVTPFFAERFAAMRWSILTPDGCAHWDGRTVRFTASVTRAEAPTADALEALWRTYYASTFNPARVRTRAMRGEMPRRYWKNLPEAELIVPLVQGAAARVREMVEAQHAERERAPRPVFRSPSEKRRAQAADHRADGPADD